MEDLPLEVLEHCCSFLSDDGISVYRLSLSSTTLRSRLENHCDSLWNQLLRFRWPYVFSYKENESSPSRNPRQEYMQRHRRDKRVCAILNDMTQALHDSFRKTTGGDYVDGSPHIGKAWSHPTWKDLIVFQNDAIDVLRKESQHRQGTFRQRLKAFLASRSLQNLSFAGCLQEWKGIQQILETNTTRLALDSSFNSEMLERYAILINEIQQTPPELSRKHDIKHCITEGLDYLAEECKKRLQDDMNREERIRAVKDFLVHEEGFTGDTEDYYNYRNSLLSSTLQTKKGIPITLAILFCCIFRRVDLDAHLIGLPGHVVLGFPEENGESCFLDVFREGEILSIDDCQQICHAYGFSWQAEFLRPLPAPLVFQRCLNNLSNCYFHALANTAEPFQADLFFNQRALASIHKQPPGVAAPLVDRLVEEIPLTLSPHLLRFYGLMAPQE